MWMPAESSSTESTGLRRECSSRESTFTVRCGWFWISTETRSALRLLVSFIQKKSTLKKRCSGKGSILRSGNDIRSWSWPVAASRQCPAQTGLGGWPPICTHESFERQTAFPPISLIHSSLEIPFPWLHLLVIHYSFWQFLQCQCECYQVRNQRYKASPTKTNNTLCLRLFPKRFGLFVNTFNYVYSARPHSIVIDWACAAELTWTCTSYVGLELKRLLSVFNEFESEY